MPQDATGNFKVECLFCNQELIMSKNGSIKTTVERHFGGSAPCGSLTDEARKNFETMMNEENKGGKRKVDDLLSSHERVRGLDHLDDIKNDVSEGMSILDDMKILIGSLDKPHKLQLLSKSHSKVLLNIKGSVMAMEQMFEEKINQQEKLLSAYENEKTALLKEKEALQGVLQNQQQQLGLAQQNLTSLQGVLQNQQQQLGLAQQNLQAALQKQQMLQDQLNNHGQQQILLMTLLQQSMQQLLHQQHQVGVHAHGFMIDQQMYANDQILQNDMQLQQFIDPEPQGQLNFMEAANLNLVGGAGGHHQNLAHPHMQLQQFENPGFVMPQNFVDPNFGQASNMNLIGDFGIQQPANIELMGEGGVGGYLHNLAHPQINIDGQQNFIDPGVIESVGSVVPP